MNEELGRLMFEHAPFGVAIVAEDGSVCAANSAFLSSVSIASLSPGDRVGRIRLPELTIASLHAGGEPVLQTEFLDRDANATAISLRLAGNRRGGSEIVAFLLEPLQNATPNDEVLATQKELETFCYAVSHDLRAPLRSIDGFAYALQQDYAENLDEDGRDYLARIRNASKRMDDLLSALLRLSRLTTSGLDLEDVNLSELAENSANDLTHLDEARSIRFCVEPGLTAVGDTRMLQAAVRNLLENAVKFTAGLAESTIEFGWDSKGGAFFVKDNGIGFDMSQSARLFQPFERLHDPRTYSGMGIGLATVYRILRKHGGRIWAEAQIDRGATFFFTLPSSR
ncbi:MAG: ATP-binding protein [Fimbriimonas sp.]|nr:ATP-binding protein [Fimbriimonas sp.]